MDIIKAICSLFILGIVMLLLGTAFTTYGEDIASDQKIIIVLLVMIFLITFICISDIYVTLTQIQTDLDAYVSDCNKKIQNKYIEASNN
mgnify:CR=1 FL=1|tara:strand:+ start:23 stop:289 length:267 start_codon:yes stop_codon:yes gene_type:complete